MGKEDDVAGFHVHICLYSPSPSSSSSAIDIFEDGNLQGVSSEKEKGTAPRSLYEIARKVDRPLDSRFQSLSIAWLDRRKGTTTMQSASRMSPDVQRKARQARASVPGNHASAPTSPLSKPYQPSTAPSTPIARFLKESSFRVDSGDRNGNGNEDGEHGGTLEISFGIVHLFRDDAALHSTKNVKTRTSLEDDSGSILAVLGVPSHIGPADFLQLIEPAADAISHVRMIREESAGRCMVMLKFRTADHAEEFHKMYADQPFNHREDSDELCRVVYVTKVTVSTTSTLPYAYPLLANSDPWPIIPTDKPSALSSGLAPVTELPTCPVCLERMDSTVTGLMTVTCQHTFHCSCLSKWSDSRCPVCRYTQSRMISKGHHLPSFVPEHGCCAICGTGVDLWVCLICAAVGCGRYKAGHAHRHFQETGHLYSLELETQRVWDYAGDGYIHRLIQSKAEFKSLDEGGPTPKTYRDPSATSKQESYSMEPSSSKGDAGRATSSNVGTSSADMEDKMEALGLEYSNLLSTQLESQRAFYEDQVHSYQRKMENSQTSSQQTAAALQEVQRDRDTLRQRIEAMTSRHDNMHANLGSSLKRLKQAEEDLRGEKLMSQGLVARIDRLIADNEARNAEMDALRAENVDLKDQVRDLMFFVEARTKVANEGGEELRDGDVALPEEKKASGSVSAKSKKKKKIPKKPPGVLPSASSNEPTNTTSPAKAEFHEEVEEDLYVET